jgi:hypothetical protein
VEDGDLVLLVHLVRLNDQIDISANTQSQDIARETNQSVYPNGAGKSEREREKERERAERFDSPSRQIEAGLKRTKWDDLSV